MMGTQIHNVNRFLWHLRCNWSFLFLWIFIIFPTVVALAYGETICTSKNGGEFIAVDGTWASSTHCSGEVCNWLEGDQIILGVYSSNPNTWMAGTATWQLDIPGPLEKLAAAELTIRWPAIYGKGLHSPLSNCNGSASVGVYGSSEFLSSILSISGSYHCPNDCFAHNCGQHEVTYDIPPEVIAATTSISVSVAEHTAWDISEVRLCTATVKDEGVDVAQGKLFVDGQPFLVKGLVYAPWLMGTGPEPYHQPFPGESDDVTSIVTHDDRCLVPDYNDDGTIQAWEVIRYDVELMKAAGVNTIRTYASGGWHDHNLNGIQEPGEINQGDLPDWVYDRLLQYAQLNGMKVIIGYWVQEENMERDRPECNWDDLEVANQALGRVIEKYKGNGAVLAWGIGNEVALSGNHTWFDWAVDVNEYLNALYAYVRTLDSDHPIFYAPFVSERVTFDSLTADIIAVNAYTHSAEEVTNSGVFDKPPPSGKAYMLGEFGHLIYQAEGHWELAQQYAGGGFLEFNNVWWKGDGQDLLGIVDAYRKVTADRFKGLQVLYGGASGMDTDMDGDVDGIDLYGFSQILAEGMANENNIALFGFYFGSNRY